MPNNHAILSASSSHRWLECPPSAKLCSEQPDTSSEYAQEGTDAHALCEHRLKAMLGMETTDPTENLTYYNEEMERCANEYAAYVSEQVEKTKVACKDPVVLIEQRLDFSRWVPEGFGTGDCVIVADGTLSVIDFKYGKGVEVLAENNPQMMLYALGALELFDGIYDIDTVSMTIFQPRRDNISEHTISKADLLQWANEVLAPTAQLAINGEGDFKAGEHCRFCKVRTICRKRAEYNLELARYDFESPATLDDIEIATILTDKIAAGLERDGILTGAGNPRWHTSTVAKILRNEKYMGDALLQKTYTVDYLSKKRIKNNGIMPQYYVENDHEAIIPKEIFMRVQDELVRRRLVKVSPNGRKHGFSSNHVFSQMIVCGECGELFRRVHWNNHGCRSIVWRCLSRLQSTGVICHARTVNEEVLKNVVLQAFNELLGSKSTYQKRLQDNLAVVLRGYEDEQAFEIDKRLAELQQELINHASRKEDYNDIADEIFRLREMKQKNFTDSAVRDEQVKRINELNDFISQQDTELTEFDESLARRWLKEITVWDDRFLVELKSGVVVEIMV